jgi:hypothetical protein
MLKLPESFVVDRKTWLRGSLSAELLTTDGTRCCVGFLAKEMGVSDDDMRHCQVLHEVIEDAESSLPGPLRSPSMVVGNDNIYVANDDHQVSDTAREARLTELFAAIGIEVRFEGEGNPVSL